MKNQKLLAYFSLYKSSGKIYFQIIIDLDSGNILFKTRRNQSHKMLELILHHALCYLEMLLKSGWKLKSYDEFNPNRIYLIETSFRLLELCILNLFVKYHKKINIKERRVNSNESIISIDRN